MLTLLNENLDVLSLQKQGPKTTYASDDDIVGVDVER